MPERQPRQVLNEAKQIAKDFGMYVVEKPADKGTDYLLFREGFPRGIFLGKRSSVEGIHKLVGKCAGGRF